MITIYTVTPELIRGLFLGGIFLFFELVIFFAYGVPEILDHIAEVKYNKSNDLIKEVEKILTPKLTRKERKYFESGEFKEEWTDLIKPYVYSLRCKQGVNYELFETIYHKYRSDILDIFFGYTYIKDKQPCPSYCYGEPFCFTFQNHHQLYHFAKKLSFNGLEGKESHKIMEAIKLRDQPEEEEYILCLILYNCLAIWNHTLKDIYCKYCYKYLGEQYNYNFIANPSCYYHDVGEKECLDAIRKVFNQFVDLTYKE